jgi:hypothetical protein
MLAAEPGMREVHGPNATVDRLVAYLLDGVAPSAGDLEGELGEWLSASSRFAAFVEAHRDKIRKKLRVASDQDARGDVRAELETAFLLLADRRIELAFEAYGSGRRGPDFTVTFRAAHRFNLEVTRPRPRIGEADRSTAIANALLGKLRQFPADAPNALLVATGLAASDDEVGATLRTLKIRADRGDETFFAGRGLSLSQFQSAYRRLAVLMVANAQGPGAFAWSNPEARRPLPAGATAVCLACLQNADWAVDPR